jgi:hypothetical protein
MTCMLFAIQYDVIIEESNSYDVFLMQTLFVIGSNTQHGRWMMSKDIKIGVRNGSTITFRIE